MNEAKMNSNERMVLAAIIARTNLGKDAPKVSDVQKLLGMKGLTIENAISHVFGDLIKSDEHFETFVEEGKSFLGEILKKSYSGIEKDYPEAFSLVFIKAKEEPPKEVAPKPEPAKVTETKKEETKMEEKADPKDIEELRAELGMKPKTKKGAYPAGNSREERLQSIIAGLKAHANSNLDKGENWGIINQLNENEIKFLIGVGRTVNSAVFGIREKLKTMTVKSIQEDTARELAATQAAKPQKDSKENSATNRPDFLK
jgi:hypothetical protein